MVSKSILAALTASFAISAIATPTSLSANTASLLRRGAEGEPFPCDDPDGTAARKQALGAAGAQQVDIAIAMLENGCHFTASYGIGNYKTRDSAEIGVYRNNWGMLRTYCDHFKGAGPDDWSNLGQQAHNDVTIATQCQVQLWNTLGADQFFSLQRGGSGNPGAGRAYGDYVWKYNDFCAAHMTDGWAIYYNVPSM
ncbi:MAG: hypothetical protein Q9181_008123 [Wetmoreana brouardii]